MPGNNQLDRAAAFQGVSAGIFSASTEVLVGRQFQLPQMFTSGDKIKGDFRFFLPRHECVAVY